MKFSLFLLLICLSFNVLTAEKSSLYCGKFNWSGKYATDNIWIDDSKFNPSITSDTKNFRNVYNELGLQGRSDGECICIKGVLKKVDYETSGEKGYGFQSIDGLYLCDSHVEIKTDIQALKKLGLSLEKLFHKHDSILEKWGLRKDDTLMSVYDKNFKINDEQSLDKAILTYRTSKPLKFRVIRENKLIYIDYKTKTNH
jgi:hypothetical protein